MRNRQAGLIFIFVTLLIDVLGLGIIIPVLPQLVGDLVGGDLSVAAYYYGWLLAAYAAAQFIFAPIMGSLSDRYGRRPVVLMALFGAGVDYLFMAIAPTLGLLFVGRIIAGIMGASFTVGNAYIADVSPPEKRAQNFGLVSAAFGIGFIIGPAIGGIIGTIGPRAPFVAAAVLTLINWLYGFFVLPESLAPENRRPFTWSRAHPIGSLMALGRYPVVLGLTATIVLVSLAGQALQSTWVLYTTYRYDWSTAQNGISLAVFGAVSIVVQLWLLRLLMPRLGERRAMVIGLLCNAIAFFLYGFASQGWMLYLVMIGTCLAFLTNPAAQGLISRQVGPNEQGAVQGALTSIVALTGIVGPPLATELFARFTQEGAPVIIPGIAFYMAGVLSLIGLGLALRAFRTLPSSEEVAAA
ncbi:MAG: TCR/Tet family MFS transporter [Anaerolineae bacterium]